MKKLLLTILLLALAITLTACKCDHAQTQTINAAPATCTADGYTGDIICTHCEEIVTPGEVIPMTGHDYGAPVNVSEANCVHEGYTGDMTCKNCGDVVEGEAIPMTDHMPGERENAREATCTLDGHTGYVNCTVCWDELDPGEVIPATGHTLGDAQNAAEATCLKDGFTGDRECSVCGEIVKGEVIPKLEHTFENNCCTLCGWRTAGLYVDGTLAFTWDEMIENDYVELAQDGARLVHVTPAIFGELVISEDITSTWSAFENSHLSAIWFPAGCTEISAETCLNASLLEEVRFFGEDVVMDGRNFEGCAALKTVILPEKLTTLDCCAFAGCPALKEIALPETLTTIIWPVSLTDGTAFAALPNVQNILYCGSEQEWEATVSKDLFPNVQITFDYTR